MLLIFNTFRDFRQHFVWLLMMHYPHHSGLAVTLGVPLWILSPITYNGSHLLADMNRRNVYNKKTD